MISRCINDNLSIYISKWFQKIKLKSFSLWSKLGVFDSLVHKMIDKSYLCVSYMCIAYVNNISISISTTSACAKSEIITFVCFFFYLSWNCVSSTAKYNSQFAINTMPLANKMDNSDSNLLFKTYYIFVWSILSCMSRIMWMFHVTSCCEFVGYGKLKKNQNENIQHYIIIDEVLRQHCTMQ